MFFVFIVRPFTFLSIKKMKKHQNWVQVKQAHTIYENRFMLYSWSWPFKVRVDNVKQLKLFLFVSSPLFGGLTCSIPMYLGEQTVSKGVNVFAIIYFIFQTFT